MGRKDKQIPAQDNGALSVGARMRAARRRGGISLTHFAQRLGYTKSYLSAVETGNSMPSQELIERYEQDLELEPGSLSRPVDEEERGERGQAPATRVVREQADHGLLDRDGRGRVEESGAVSSSIMHRRFDWGEAPSGDRFYGRQKELAHVEQWIVQDRCKVISILGIGGMGKTALASKGARQVKDAFDCVFWRSLQSVPPLRNILEQCIHFISDQQGTDLPTSEEELITILINHLRAHRCLLILDNFESVLKSENRAGDYKEGYAGYGALLQRLGESEHQSCLILTSREKPREIPRLEGIRLQIRSMGISGVELTEGRRIIEEEGLEGSEATLAKFIRYYSGNPLALKLVSSSIRELFGGNIDAFLGQGGTVFGDIYTLLAQQFHRLSRQEQQLMYWLAVEQDAVTVQELGANIVPSISMRSLQEALESLRRRSMIEGGERLSLQPVIMDYVIEDFLDEVYRDIEAEEFRLLASHALMKGQAKDFAREGQVRRILEPSVRHLLLMYGQEESEQKLKGMLARLQQRNDRAPSYAAGNLLNLLIQLQADLSNFDLSHLVVRQAYLPKTALPGVSFVDSDLTMSVFADTFGSVMSVAFSNDGDLLAAGTASGEVRLWGAHSGQPVHSCAGHTDWVRSVAFSPDSKLLASGSHDQTVRLWDTSTGLLLKVLSGHENRIKSVAFSLDGTLLASGGDDQTVRIWDVQTGDCRFVLRGHESRVYSVAFSPHSPILASGSEDQTVRLWNAHTGEFLSMLPEHTSWIWTVAFSPDSKLLATGSEDQAIRIWEVQTGRCLQTLRGHTSRIYAVTFSPDSELLASGSEDRTVRIWETDSGEHLHTLHGHASRVWDVAFNAEGSWLVSSSDDQTMRIWEVQSGQCRYTLQGHNDWVWDVAFSPDSTLLASGCEDQEIRIWEMETRTCNRSLHAGAHRVRCVNFSPDGESLASGSEDELVRLWQVNTGIALETLPGHTQRIRSVAFSPNGTLLASGSDDQAVLVWNIQKKQRLYTLTEHSNRVYSVAFSPDSQVLASGSEDRSVRVWEMNTGSCLRVLREHESRVYSLAFSLDGRFLVSGSDDQTVRIWEMETGRLLRTLLGHNSRVYSVACSPNGQVLVSAGDDQVIRVWEVHTGRCLHELRGHTNRIYSVKFNIDGSILASGSHDRTIRLWDVQAGKCLDTLRSDRLYERMDITNARGLTSAQKIMLRTLGAKTERYNP
ncbi:MAG: NB-ARC domain-containing protein [Chloroflexota bacterium]|nr:NB-ARC domain-containing protein [Chloroflexota bacterium]